MVSVLIVEMKFVSSGDLKLWLSTVVTFDFSDVVFPSVFFQRVLGAETLTYSKFVINFDSRNILRVLVLKK